MKVGWFSSVPGSVRPSCVFLGLALGLPLVFCLPKAALANVYATNLRLNGGTNIVAIGAGGSVTIGYLLNDVATAGVTVEIVSGSGIVRTIASTGTNRGPNSIVWDGKDDNANPVGPGTYSIRITASAGDYGDWTLIGTDTYVAGLLGIAVNRNTNSFYYGRVFVSKETSLFDSVPPGLQKFNADGSAAEEGSFSDGGWPWAGDGFSPWKIEVSPDDFVYVGDFNLTNGGTVVRFDQTVSSNSQTAILRSDNWPSNGVRFSGPFITGQGAGTRVWMADTNSSGVGIRRWNVTANGILATNDTGTTIVQAGDSSQLDQAPFDVTVDASNRIYTIQSVLDSGNPSDRVFRFPAYTNVVETNADWHIGGGDSPSTMLGACGIAVDPTATYLAVAFRIGSDMLVGGHLTVFDAATGGVLTTLAQPNGVDTHDHSDVAWDNVGNLYVCDLHDSVWRAYSPPGANQATTVAQLTVQVTTPPTRPLLSNPFYGAGQFQCTLTGQANVSYVILASTDPGATQWLPVLTNTAPAAIRPISVAAPNGQSYYRAVVAP